METYYAMPLTKFRKSEKWKNKKLKYLLIKIISTVPKLIFFKTTVLCTVCLFSEYADNLNIINLG